jgi:phosphohistidine phosphatase
MKMKNLIVLRHGKAEQYHEEGDAQRVLAERGLKDSRRMGKLIKEKIGVVDLVVSSPAARAAQTARIAAQAIGYEGEIKFRSEIYAASDRVLLDLVSGLPKTAGTVLLVGHNPGLEELIEDLTDSELPDGHLPTAGVAHIVLDVPWSEAVTGSGTLVGQYSPKSNH